MDFAPNSPDTVVFAASSFLRSTTIEVDTGRRRIKMVVSWLNRPAHTIFDVDFDECDGVGIGRVSHHEGPYTFDAYLKLKSGEAYRIPQGKTDTTDARLAEETLARFIAVSKLKRIDGPPEPRVWQGFQRGSSHLRAAQSSCLRTPTSLSSLVSSS